jgi:predicted PurR-regulated permease PerM
MQVDLTRLILAIVAIVGLIGGSLWVLSPFLAAIVWATMIAVATWPLMLRVQAAMWGRRALAVAVMTLAMLLVFLIPVLLAAATIIDHADDIVRWTRFLLAMSFPPPPAWLGGLPLVGGALVDLWSGLQVLEARGLVDKLTPFAGTAARWLGDRAGETGLLLLHFMLTILITAIMYAQGESAAEAVQALARRVGGLRAEHAVQLAVAAIRGVALGVVLTAVIQAAAAGVGIAIAGIPFAGLLTAAAFILCIAAVGPGPVLIPAVIWLFWSGQPGWGTFLLVWSIAVMTIDNFLRPVLIRKGADLPMLLIFAGVIGGLFSMGFVGLFVGPVVLAVTYMMFEAWTAEPADTPAGPPAQDAATPAATPEVTQTATSRRTAAPRIGAGPGPQAAGESGTGPVRTG